MIKLIIIGLICMLMIAPVNAGISRAGDIGFMDYIGNFIQFWNFRDNSQNDNANYSIPISVMNASELFSQNIWLGDIYANATGDYMYMYDNDTVAFNSTLLNSTIEALIGDNAFWKLSSNNIQPIDDSNNVLVQQNLTVEENLIVGNESNMFEIGYNGVNILFSSILNKDFYFDSNVQVNGIDVCLENGTNCRDDYCEDGTCEGNLTVNGNLTTNEDMFIGTGTEILNIGGEDDKILFHSPNDYDFQFDNDMIINGTLQLEGQSTVVCNSNQAGRIYYDSDDNHFYGCNSTNWVMLG